MSVVARHTCTLELELEAAVVGDLNAARKMLAERVSHVIPFAPMTVTSGRRVRVVSALVSSPGLRSPIRVSPRSARSGEGLIDVDEGRV